NQDPNELPDDPDEPVVADPVDKNSAFGIFYIPRFGDDYYRTVAEGVDLEPVLNRMGVGRYPNSAMPGDVGNFSVAGHRVTYGKPFNQIGSCVPAMRSSSRRRTASTPTPSATSTSSCPMPSKCS